jgi:hypothetical protein
LGEAVAEAEVPRSTAPVYSNKPPRESVAKDGRKCELCTKLGMGGDTHSREWCYIDPRSRAYKPEVR